MSNNASIIPYLTSHSPRTTLVTVLAEANYSGKHIRSITGHESDHLWDLTMVLHPSKGTTLMSWQSLLTKKTFLAAASVQVKTSTTMTHVLARSGPRCAQPEGMCLKIILLE